MFDRETIVPLSIGALIASAVHVLLLPAWAESLRNTGAEPRPDLTVHDVKAPPTAVAGQTISLTAVIANDGQADAVLRNGDGQRTWQDRVYLSADTRIDDTDTELHRTDTESAAKAAARELLHPAEDYGWRQDAPLQLTLPAHATGPMFLIVVADAEDRLHESNEKNNTGVAPITIETEQDVADRPDLVVEHADAPTAVRNGEPLKIDITVANMGVSAASSEHPWADVVYLSADGRLSNDDVLIAAAQRAAPLAPQSRYTATTQGVVALPDDAIGRRYLIIHTDARGQVAETDEANNIFVRAIDVLAAERRQPQPGGKPDLELAAIQAPPSVMSGDTFNVDYLVANRGNGAPTPGKWRDRLYLSTDKQLDPSDTLLAEADNPTAPGPGGHYRQRASVKVTAPYDEQQEEQPQQPKPQLMYLIARTDADDAVGESNEENNTRVVPLEVNAVRLGKEDAEERLTVAWIPHESFQKLIARQYPTHQPALQPDVDPVPKAPTPNRPTPAAPNQPQQRAVAQANPAGQVNPSTTPAPRPTQKPVNKPLAKRPDARSPVTDKAPPTQQARAEAPVTRPVLPTLEPPATGPDRLGQPVQQVDADSTVSKPGRPGTQKPSQLPLPIAPLTDPSAPDAAANAVERITRKPATSPTVTKPTDQPTTQPRADSPKPTTGDPTKLTQAKAPKPTDGKPTTLARADTPKPAPDGRPATSKRVDGSEQTEPKPTPESNKPGRKPNKPNTDRQQQQPTPSASRANPTSAPRDPSFVTPTQLTRQPVEVVPGGVITGPGIEIKAARFNITPVSAALSGPTARNPIARMAFDKSGKVTDVELIRTTGHTNLDSQVRAGFFNFRAKGKRLEKLRHGFSVDIKLLLHPEHRKGPDAADE